MSESFNGEEREITSSENIIEMIRFHFHVNYTYALPEPLYSSDSSPRSLACLIIKALVYFDLRLLKSSQILCVWVYFPKCLKMKLESLLPELHNLNLYEIA